MIVKWVGPRPPKCQLCDVSLVDRNFVDGKTQTGPWANMCESCHATHGVGLGLGRGQLYDPKGVKIRG